MKDLSRSAIEEAGFSATSISEMAGKTLTKIDVIDNEIIKFIGADGSEFIMLHVQDVALSYVDDIIGDMNDLIGSPIAIAHKSSGRSGVTENEFLINDEYLWTLFHLATDEGWVTFRWFATSPTGPMNVEIFSR